MSKSVTLAQIAKACGGVSTSTVSLALRNSPKIPEATRRKIKGVASQMGYSANRSVSRVMSEIRSGGKQQYKETLGYITTLSDNFEKPIYNGVTQRAAEIGYNTDRFEVDLKKTDLKALQRNIIARGIRGLILSPFAQHDTTLDLDWQQFAAVSIGYTLIKPELTRVARDQAHSVRTTFAKLQARGYERIGFTIERPHEARMDYSNLAGFLLYEWHCPPELCVPPLIPVSLNRELFTDWFQTHKPDLVVTMHFDTRLWLLEMGLSIPKDVGFFVLNAQSTKSEYSGIYPDYEGLGACAVEQVSSLVERGEFGPPKSAKTLLIDGIWVEGTTIKTAPNK